jgi:RNA 3'-terminal phosphate cyclase (ATP)
MPYAAGWNGCSFIPCQAINGMLEIDGSIGEGGGQVLRTALSVSCVLQKKVRVKNIRAGRPKPGLAAQHLAVCRLLSEISGAQMEGASLGSSEIVFNPGEISGGEYKFNIGTAGSCTLLFQSALPVLAHAREKSSLEITGGTHVPHSPTFEYFSEIFLPSVKKFGVHASATLLRPGFYPKGNGKAILEAEQSRVRGHLFVPLPVAEVNYSIISSSLPPHVLPREVNTIKRFFPKSAGVAQSLPADCPGNAVTVWGGAFGESALGERGKPSENVASEACEPLLRDISSGASVDSHLADQILIYAALADGKSRYAAPHFSSHLRTNAEVLRLMTGRNIILGSDMEVSVE